jgi:hypothetical protein
MKKNEIIVIKKTKRIKTLFKFHQKPREMKKKAGTVKKNTLKEKIQTNV